MVQLTRRDEAMLEWLSVVRFAEMDAIRWALPALADEPKSEPVTLRNAQQWVVRLLEVGLLNRARLNFNDPSIVWPTYGATGRSAPRLHRQTTRHELAVSFASAVWLAHGYEWARDRRPIDLSDHMADGVATRGDRVDLVEVELTPKTLHRYKLIHTSHAERLEGEVSRIVYLTTPAAGRVVAREADRYLFRDLRERLVIHPVLDARGRWTGDVERVFAGQGPAVLSEGSERLEPLWDRGIL